MDKFGVVETGGYGVFLSRLKEANLKGGEKGVVVDLVGRYEKPLASLFVGLAQAPMLPHTTFAMGLARDMSVRIKPLS